MLGWDAAWAHWIESLVWRWLSFSCSTLRTCSWQQGSKIQQMHRCSVPHKADALSKSDGTWGLCYSKPDGLHVCHDQDHPLEEEVRPEMKLKRADGCHQLAGADYGGLLDTFNGWQVPNCNDKTWQWLARPPDRFAGKLWGQGHCFNQIDPNSFLADGQVLHSRELRASRVLFDMIWHIYRCDISIYIYYKCIQESKRLFFEHVMWWFP